MRHNLAAIRYRNFDFFLGVYPNDEATLAATTQLAETFHNVHVAECAKPGPPRRLIALIGSIAACCVLRRTTGCASTPSCCTMPKT